MTAEPIYITTRIEPNDPTSGFQCGKAPLDQFFNSFAYTNEQSGASRTYVFRRSDADPVDFPRVLGFYSLSMAQVESGDVARITGQRLPRYPMPAAKIGRFAIDLRVQGRGLGGELLVDAVKRASAAAGVLGCTGVVLDAKDDAAHRFYLKFGFVPITIGSWPVPMFLPMQSIVLMLEAAASTADPS